MLKYFLISSALVLILGTIVLSYFFFRDSFPKK